MLCGWQSWLDKQRKKCTTLPWNTGNEAKHAASAEFSFTEQTNWTPGPMRHQSLPRRLLGNLVSERNLNEEVEQSFLKQFLKEHGLYNKHQTVQQRRRLKYLLELEQRTKMQVAKGQKDMSIVPSDTDRGICSIELHSMPFLEPNTSPKQLCNSFASSLPRTSSLSALKSVTDTDFHFDEACTSLPSFTHQAKDVVNSKGLKTVSWETSESFLETEF